MDWLYAGPASHVDREEYLLGKRIDRQIDPLLASEEKEKEVRERGWGMERVGVTVFLLWQALASGPGALFSAPDTANSAADLAVKVREDPLFLIRKKEEEAKKQLASNPIKMRQLQEVRRFMCMHKSLHNVSLLVLCCLSCWRRRGTVSTITSQRRRRNTESAPGHHTGHPTGTAQCVGI